MAITKTVLQKIVTPAQMSLRKGHKQEFGTDTFGWTSFSMALASSS